MDTSPDTAIKVTNISKDFILPTEQSNTLKSVFTSFLKLHQKADNVQHALGDISFEIKRGEFFGIVGRNGSGKSTLLKILAGIYQPTAGNVQTNGRLVPFIELGVGFNGELTGRENIYLNGAMLGFAKQEIDDMYDSIVAFAELERFMDQKLKNYSSGMQVRLAFSLAIRADAEILLVDEVLAVGDADFQKKCYKYFKSLKRDKKTVVFVSHDMNAVQEYCDRAVLIEKSELVFAGSSHDVAMAYTRMFLEQEKSTDELKNKKKRWGNHLVEYQKVGTGKKMFHHNDRTLTVTTKAIVNKNVDQAIFGFSVRGEDDTVITGTNSKLKGYPFENLKKGDTIEITWSLPNIFNTGNYFIDAAIQSKDYDDVFDWWDEAVVFQVEREGDNPFPVYPEIEVAVKKD